MPFPKPQNNENHDDFIERCMSDSVMLDEYPDEKQRYAVCQSQLDEETNTMTAQIERRVADLDSLEIRADAEGEARMLRGHAAVFGQKSVDLGGFREIIEQGAFAAAIARDDVRSLFNHDPSLILGRNKSGTLELSEDNNGLYFNVELPDTSYARDLEVSVERGDVSQCSFAFMIDGKGERWEVDGEEVKFVDAFDVLFGPEKHQVVRYVTKARLFDVSPVTFAAYPQTDVKARAAMECAGIDYDQLLSAAGSARRGDATSEETESIKRAISVLSTLIATDSDEPDGRESQDTGAVGCVAQLRRRLQLLDL